MQPFSLDVIRRGLLNTGDTTRLQQALTKAQRGEKITLGFIGGSITEGAHATKPEHRYVERVGAWWRATFPQTEIEVINAGIGATNSIFGAMRVQRDVLASRPDVLIVDYGVNDRNTEEFARSYEGLLRQALTCPSQPGIVLLYLVNREGENAQEWLSKVGAHYHLPMVSYRDAVWPEIEAGRIKWTDISPDEVHPNDFGHDVAAQVVTTLIADVLKTLPATLPALRETPLPAPLLTDLFERTSLATGSGLTPIANHGWTLETAENPKATGWKATQPGSVIEFEIPGTTLYVQYWKINGPMGKVRLTIDGKPAEEELDAWFDLTWGGYNMMSAVAQKLPSGIHRLRIELLADKHPQSTGTDFIITGIGSAGA